MTNPNEASQFNDPAAAIDEKALLMQRARLMGLNPSPNIGLETLRQKVKDALEGRADTADGTIVGQQNVKVDENETPSQRDQRLRQEIIADQMALTRIRITNMNPAKADLRGEIWTVGNKYVGTVRKFIPYGEASEVGYHVPKILLTMLQEQKFHQIKTRQGKDKREIIAESKLVKEFAIEILPPLTAQEMADLKASQMARGDITSDN